MAREGGGPVPQGLLQIEASPCDISLLFGCFIGSFTDLIR